MLKSAFTKDKIEVGVDEVGRGCIAGPVVAAAVILPKKYKNKILDDSKKLTEKKRLLLDDIIKKDAMAWAIGEVDNKKIDEINILKASFLAMHKAMDKLTESFEFILVDGNRFTPYKETPHECVIKGDGKYLSIAAASVLAKNYRDKLMAKLAVKYPHYGWERNAAYPTKQHRAGIKKHGVTKYHRMSFKLLPDEVATEK